MSEESKAALRAEIAAAKARGAEALATRLLQELGTLHLASEELEEARAALEEALAAHEEAARPVQAAEVRYALGLLAKLEGEAPSLEALEASAREFEALGDAAGEVRALKRLAAQALGQGEHGRCAGALDRIEARASSREDEATQREVWQLRALLLHLQGDPEGAMASLRRALESAAASGLEGEAAHLGWMGVGLSAQDAPAAEGEAALARAASEAQARGEVTVAAWMELQRAAPLLELGRLKEAAALVSGARATALETLDPTLYLMACLGEAHLQEVQGDDVAVLTTLYTCRASLSDLLGEGAGDAVLFLVRSCHHRWGDARFQRARQAYRAQFS